MVKAKKAVKAAPAKKAVAKKAMPAPMMMAAAKGGCKRK